jgi:hypothetical protein
MLRHALAVALTFSAFAARAQDAAPAPTPTVVPTPAAPPIVAVEEDRSVVLTDDDELLYGAARQKVSNVELFKLLGRDDLLAQSAQNEQRRTVLAITGGGVAVAGIAVGIALLATAPDLTQGPCGVDIKLYNEQCRAEAAAHQIGGIVGIAGGVLVGGLLGSIASWSRPEVFTKSELRKFVNEHNTAIGAPKSTLRLQLRPALSPGFSGLVASGTF